MSDICAITKGERRILERLFVQEVHSALDKRAHVVQMRSRTADKLVAEGLIRLATVNMGRDRFGSISVTGYELTEAGRMLYCMSCGGVDEGAA